MCDLMSARSWAVSINTTYSYHPTVLAVFALPSLHEAQSLVTVPHAWMTNTRTFLLAASTAWCEEQYRRKTVVCSESPHNKAVETDAQGRPRAKRASILGRRSLLRYAS
jgi:hypothetical protein